MAVHQQLQTRHRANCPRANCRKASVDVRARCWRRNAVRRDTRDGHRCRKLGLVGSVFPPTFVTDIRRGRAKRARAHGAA